MMAGFEFKDFEKYESKIKKLQGKDLDTLNKKVVNRIAGEYLRRVVSLTPVGDYGENNKGRVGGTLRRGWSIDGRPKKNLGGYSVDVVNPVEYASYVNFGHRTRGGKGWVEGQFFAEAAEEETQRVIQNPVRKIVEYELRRSLDAD